MNTKFPSLALSLGVLLASAGASFANGTYVYSNGSTKDYAAGVPVPAPMPVPMKEALWYLRLDVGGSFVGSVDADAQGVGIVPRDAGDIPGSVFGEAGFGYRFTESFRIDFTTNVHDSYSLTDPDLVTMKNQSTNLVNFYYDFANPSSFTPYVGVGVGTTFVTASVERSVQENSEWLFSGALMAGLTYDINEYLALDTGYRLLYSAGGLQYTDPATNSRVSWDGFLHHQFRTGLRLKIF